MSYSPHVYIDLSSDGSPGWVDITSDVMADPGVEWEYGIRSNRIEERVAFTGFMRLTLDNRSKRYSPNSTDCLAGFGLGNRLKVTFEGTPLGSAIVWSSDAMGYSDYTFGDGLYHVRSTDRNATGTSSDTSLYTGSDFTLSLWVKASTDDAWGYTTTAGFSSDALFADVFDFSALFDTDLLQANLTAHASDGTYAVGSLLASLTFSTDVLTAQVPLGSSTDWVHVCMVAEIGNALSIYVNGSLAKTAACVQVATSDVTSEQVTVFKKAEPGFLGSLGHLAIFNRALSASEVSSIVGRKEFQRDALYTCSDGPPTYYWDFGGASGTSTNDPGLKTADADEFTKFIGYIQSINPKEDIAGEKVTEITCQDWMGKAARYNVGPVPAQVEQPSGTVLEQVIAYSNIVPMGREIDAGLNLFTYAADLSKAETPILAEFSKIAKSEPGFVYVRGGATSDGDMGEVLTYEDRARRQQRLTNEMALDDNGTSDSMVSLSVQRTMDPLYNKIRATIHPVAVDASAVVIYTQDTNVIPEVPAESSATIFCGYSDSDAAFETVGAVDVERPVRNVDYTINTAQSGGADMTLDLLEAMKATMSSDRIAHWPMTDGSLVALKDDVTPRPIYRGDDDDSTSTSGGITISTNTVIRTYFVALPGENQ